MKRNGCQTQSVCSCAVRWLSTHALWDDCLLIGSGVIVYTCPVCLLLHCKVTVMYYGRFSAHAVRWLSAQGPYFCSLALCLLMHCEVIVCPCAVRWLSAHALWGDCLPIRCEVIVSSCDAIVSSCDASWLSAHSLWGGYLLMRCEVIICSCALRWLSAHELWDECLLMRCERIFCCMRCKVIVYSFAVRSWAVRFLSAHALWCDCLLIRRWVMLIHCKLIVCSCAVSWLSVHVLWGDCLMLMSAMFAYMLWGEHLRVHSYLFMTSEVIRRVHALFLLMGLSCGLKQCLLNWAVTRSVIWVWLFAENMYTLHW